MNKKKNAIITKVTFKNVRGVAIYLSKENIPHGYSVFWPEEELKGEKWVPVETRRHASTLLEELVEHEYLGYNLFFSTDMEGEHQI